MDEAEAIEAPCEPARYRVLRRIAENPDNFLAVGFGGGSFPGLAANCALADLLEELDLRPRVREVWGTSAGSIVGAGFASGLTGRRVLELAAGMGGRRAVDIPLWEVAVKGLVNLVRRRGLPEGIVRGRVFREAIAAGLPVETIEACEIPFFAITCTDDGHARKVVLDAGPLVHAVAASMCIPGVMFPVPAPGTDHGYMDGGVVEKTPLVSIIDRHARAGRDEQLVVVATHYDDGGRIAPPRGFLERFVRTIDRLEEVTWEHQLDRAREAPDCKFVILNPRLEIGGMFAGELLRFNYLWGRKRYKEQLSNAQLGGRFTAR
jgi:predicted acylesterase/phospholipase RssA